MSIKTITYSFSDITSYVAESSGYSISGDTITLTADGYVRYENIPIDSSILSSKIVIIEQSYGSIYFSYISYHSGTNSMHLRISNYNSSTHTTTALSIRYLCLD